VIFVTSYNQHAITAIKFNALDYLLKPVEISDLRMAVTKALNNRKYAGYRQAQMASLQQHLAGDVSERRFAVHHGEKVKMLPEKDIVYIEADKRYCTIRMNTGKDYVTSRHLKEFEDYFGERSSFIRINKTFIINTDHILEYTKGGLFTIEMSNGSVFEVSRRKKSQVLEKLKRFFEK
jgi:two-component system LytT family response regulator